MTPESLGAYLTQLVAEKNAHYADDDSELYACGMLATLQALSHTTGHGLAVAERLRGIIFVLMRYLVGWPVRDDLGR